MPIPRSVEEFAAVGVLDTEFVPMKGNRHVLVAVGYRRWGGEQVRVWGRQELLSWPTLPFPCDKQALFVGYNVAVEAAFMQVLGWDQPSGGLDRVSGTRWRRRVSFPKIQ